MNIIINGKTQELEAPYTITQLLTRMELADERVAVEYNGDILSQTNYATTVLAAGDVLEVVRFVGGG